MTDQPSIDASPTKHFFIRMLVKDIDLIQVIPDLVDNCVDGARRIREDENFSDLWVHIETTQDHFRIADNCGGIPKEIAQKYAFRFGRPEDMPPELQVPHSTGQFGIGMKRALFKLGDRFRIESQTERFRFVVEEIVSDWEKKKEWTFEFAELEELKEAPPPNDRGTVITVTSLHKNVAEDFTLGNFAKRLRAELESKHQSSMKEGLTITLNRIPLQARPLELLYSSELKPAYQTRTFKEPDRPGITVKIYAGISESDPQACGWHIFCNGRLILEADKDRVTGWGDGNPRYHPQYNMFRGYVFFDSDDVVLLPWNTTKDGVDADSPRFRTVRLEMIKMMRPVITFLNRLDAEKERDREALGPLESAVNAAEAFELAELPSADLSRTFVAPKPKSIPPKPQTTRILYSKPVEKVRKVKQILDVSSNRAVGEKTFDYFCEVYEVE